MDQFIAVVHKDEDSAFGIHFPDLPGCFSAADSLNDIVRSASEALSLYFEDMADVPPSSFEHIMQLAKDDIAEGAFLIAVPRVSNRGQVERVNISLDRGTLEAIDAAAKARKMTRSAFIAEAAINEIECAH